MKKLFILIFIFLLLMNQTQISANTNSSSDLYEITSTQIDEYTTVEKTTISTSPLIYILDYTNSTYRAIFTVFESKITRIDYLDINSGKIYYKIVNDNDKTNNYALNQNDDFKILLNERINNINIDNEFMFSGYINFNYLDNEENSQIQTQEQDHLMGIDYYSIALSRFKSYYGDNYYNILRHTLLYRGLTGRVYETATSNVVRRYTLDQIFTPGTALSVIALALGWPYNSIKSVVSAIIGVGQALYTIYTNNVIDWTGIKSYQKDVDVNGRITWKTYAEFKANGVLIIDADKGSNALWSNGSMTYYDGKTYYENNVGLIQKGIDNYIISGF